MENVFFALIAGFAIGFLVCIVVTTKIQPPQQAQQPLDLHQMMLQQMQAQQLQNSLRAAQLESTRQEAELLALTQQRNQVARLNYSDIQRLSAYTGGYSDTAHIPQ
jgi:Na+-translocating ferredoxin:NAD+ oxidoreductase RnfG subunit